MPEEFSRSFPPADQGAISPADSALPLLPGLAAPQKKPAFKIIFGVVPPSTYSVTILLAGLPVIASPARSGLQTGGQNEFDQRTVRPREASPSTG